MKNVGKDCDLILICFLQTIKWKKNIWRAFFENFTFNPKLILNGKIIFLLLLI